MSESVIQADIQRELLKLTSLFSAGDVVISDWSVLDGSSQSAPFAIIDTANDFSMDGVQADYSVTWQIPFDLVVRFIDWDTSRLAIRDARETIVNALRKTENYNSASAILAYGIRRIYSGSGISEVYDKYNENAAESLPAFLSQTITLEVVEIGSG